MAIDIIGAEQASSGILGAGAKVFEGKFGLFGKYSSAIQPGTYVITSTAGNKGGRELDIKRLTSGAGGVSTAGSVAIDEVAVAESGLIAASRSSKFVFTSDSKLNDEIISTSAPAYTGASSRTASVASSPTTTVVAVYSVAYTSSSVAYWDTSIYTKIGSGSWTRPVSISGNYNSNEGGPAFSNIHYTGGRFILSRRARSSSAQSSYPNVILESVDGVNWTTSTPVSPYGGSGSTSHYPSVLAKLGSTYYMKANNNNFLASTTDVTNSGSYTNIDSTLGAAFTQFFVGTPYQIGINGTTIVVTTFSSGLTEGPGTSLIYSTNSGATWQIPTLPSGYRYLTNPIFSNSKWYVAAISTSDSYYDLLVSTNLTSWTTFNMGTAVTQMQTANPRLEIIPGGGGFRVGGSSDRYAFWTTSSNIETTSWTTSSTTTEYYEAKLMRANLWVATNGNYDQLGVNTNQYGSQANWNMLTASSVSGAQVDSSYSLPPTAAAHNTVNGVTVWAGRGYINSPGIYRNIYFQTSSTSPTSTGNWTRYYSPIGLTSSTTPVVHYLSVLGVILMVNNATGEWATSVNGTTWTVGGGTFPVSLPSATQPSTAPVLNGADLLMISSSDVLYGTTSALPTFTTTASPISFGKPQVQDVAPYGTGLAFVTNQGHVITSQNGTAWTTSKPFTDQPTIWTYGTEIWGRGTFNGLTTWRRTTDNVTWTTITGLSNAYDRVAKLGNKYVAFGNRLNVVAYSTNGTIWDEVSAGGNERNLQPNIENGMVGVTNTTIELMVENNATQNRQASFATFDADEKYGVAYFNSTFVEL